MVSDESIITYIIAYAIIVIICTIYLVREYSQKGAGIIVRGVVFTAWTLAFTTISLLPVDLLDVDHVEKILVKLWTCLYWVTFFSVWVFVPIMQDYIDSGAFRWQTRLLDAVIPSLKHYVVIIGIAVAAIITLLAVGIITFSDLPVLAMSLSVCYGLILLTITLAYGSVEVPRSLWHRGDRTRRRAYLAYSIGKLYDDALEEQDRLVQTHSLIARLGRSTDFPSNLASYLDITAAACPSPGSFDFVLGSTAGSSAASAIDPFPALASIRERPAGTLREKDIAALHHLARKHARAVAQIRGLWEDAVDEALAIEALAAARALSDARPRAGAWLAAPYTFPAGTFGCGRSDGWVAQDPAAAAVLAAIYSVAPEDTGAQRAASTATGVRSNGGYRRGSFSRALDDATGGSGPAAAAGGAAPGGLVNSSPGPSLDSPAAAIASREPRCCPSLRSLRYHAAVLWRPYLVRAVAVVLGMLSLLLLWSELAYVLPINLSPIAALADAASSSLLASQLVTLLPVAYIAVCVYFTLFSVRIGRNYIMLTRQRTDSVSMLHNATFALLLTPPTARNYFLLLRSDNSAINKAMGKPGATVVPVINYFIKYFPVVIIALAAAVFFNLFGKLLSWLGARQFRYDEPETPAGAIGRQQIERARKSRFGLRSRPIGEMVPLSAPGTAYEGLRRTSSRHGEPRDHHNHHHAGRSGAGGGHNGRRGKDTLAALGSKLPDDGSGL